jgi:hypothetical protein
VATLAVIAQLAIAQTVAHLVVVLDAGRIGTIVDLDRSNGLPDIVSTLALALATVGAGLVACWGTGGRTRAAGGLAAVLAVLTLADILHDGAHPKSPSGAYVIGLVIVAGVLLTVVGRSCAPRTRATLVIAGATLVCSFLVTGLDRVNHWFERARGDPIAEYQIVAKEGLELVGWSLVALGLWDEALRRRGKSTGLATATASRARAPSRRRAS